MAKMELAVGPSRLVVDDKDILFEKINLMIEKLGEINLKHSLFAKYPMEDDETTETWYDRILPLMIEDEGAKKEDESTADYVKRIHTQKNVNADKFYDTLLAIAQVFGQEAKVTPEAFQKTSAPLAQDFIVEVLKKCKLATKGYE